MRPTWACAQLQRYPKVSAPPVGSTPPSSQCPVHHQSDFEMFTWLMKGPVPLSLCAADKVLPIPAEASSQLAVSYYSHSGRGDQAGPQVEGLRAQHGDVQSAKRESQRTEARTREHASSQSVRSRTPYSNSRAHTPCASCSTEHVPLTRISQVPVPGPSAGAAEMLLTNTRVRAK